MNDTPLRGMRIGALSYESEIYVVPVERHAYEYRCDLGHVTSVQFAAEAEELPLTWSCRCGREAHAAFEAPNLAQPVDLAERHQRTHWDMLRERRSIAELETLLAERLALLGHVRAEDRKSA